MGSSSNVSANNIKDGNNKNQPTKQIVQRVKSRRRRRLELRKLESSTTSVCSVNTPVGQLNFKRFGSLDDDDVDNKEGKRVMKPLGITVAGVADNDNDRTFTCLSHGIMSTMGRGRVMEDAVMVAPGMQVGEGEGEVELDSYDFFAVYDGHGGATVANACRDRMHQLLAREVRKEGMGGREGLEYWERVMGACFDKMDEEVGAGGGGREVAARGIEEEAVVLNKMGSTAAAMMLGKEKVVVANCGDSRMVLCRGGVAVPLSRDHKVTRDN